MKHHRDPISRKPRYCDPGMCEHCEYIGEGDFICENPKVTDGGEAVVVVEEWENTENFMACKKAAAHITEKQKTNVRPKSEFSANGKRGASDGKTQTMPEVREGQSVQGKHHPGGSLGRV